MSYEIELRLPALQSCLHVVDACVGRVCRTALGGENLYLQEAVRAACLHAIEHAYGGGDVDYRLELCFAVDTQELRVTLVDTGARTNALQRSPLAEIASQLSGASYERHATTNIVTFVCRKPS